MRAALVLMIAMSGAALAGALDAISAKDASGGVRAALSQGIDRAVTQLGARNGFLGDPKVAIPLPEPLRKVESGLRLVGLGRQADELRETMNHAAEDAVAQAKPVFVRSLQQMTLTDARNILAGGDGAATAYFRQSTSAALTAKFRPIVATQTAKLGLAAKYDEYAGKAAQFGLVPAGDASLNDYVTARALDGLYSRIAEEEHRIRQNPLGESSALIRKAFSAL